MFVSIVTETAKRLSLDRDVQAGTYSKLQKFHNFIVHCVPVLIICFVLFFVAINRVVHFIVLEAGSFQ